MGKLVAVACVLAACGGKGGPDAFPEVPAAAKQAWEGAWVLVMRHDDRDSGVRAAVEVHGDRARVFDGAGEHLAVFTIDRPCEAAFRLPGATTHIQFAYAGGELHVGNGGVGVRHGEDAVVCGTGRDPGAPEEGVYVLAGNHCATWKQTDGAWSSRTGVCVWSNERGEDIVDVGTEHYHTLLVVDGDLLRSKEFSHSELSHEARRMASFDAAKAAVTESIDATDPLAQARAAGGEVGDLSSIAGLMATFAADRAGLRDKDLELPAAFVETSKLTIQSQVWNEVLVGDPAHPAARKLICQTLDDPSGLATGAKLVVRGRIDPAQDVARLRPCHLAK